MHFVLTRYNAHYTEIMFYLAFDFVVHWKASMADQLSVRVLEVSPFQV